MEEFFELESFIFSMIDDFKLILSPEQWGSASALMNFSKSEIFVLLFVNRRKKANVSEIAEYINAPLNTVTGIIGRLERQKLVERLRCDTDRRVVNIVLTEQGRDLMQREMSIIGGYIKELYAQLTEQEKTAALSIFAKLVKTFKEKNATDVEDKKIKRITIE